MLGLNVDRSQTPDDLEMFPRYRGAAAKNSTFVEFTDKFQILTLDTTVQLKKSVQM